VVRAEISKLEGEVDLFVVDEIGTMECFSNAFISRRLLDSWTPPCPFRRPSPPRAAALSGK
jgi:hypothetical protein